MANNSYKFTGSATVTTSYVTVATVIAGVHTVDSATANVASGRVPSGHVVNFELANAGGATISDCRIQLQDHPDGEWYSYLGATDFDSATNVNVLFSTTTGPHEVTTGNSAHAHVRINAAYAFRIQAKLASGSGTVTVYGTLKAA